MLRESMESEIRLDEKHYFFKLPNLMAKPVDKFCQIRYNFYENVKLFL